MSEDLKKLKVQILEYVKKEGFNVFYGKEAPTAKPSIEMQWFSEEGDWKDFLKVAKLEGVKTIIINYSTLTEADIEINLQMAETEGIRSANEPSKKPESLKDHVGKIGELNLIWIKDGIRYTYTEATDWWLDFQSFVAPKPVTHEFIPEEEVISPPYVQIPEDLKSKTAEELADEMIGFIKKEFPDVGEHVSFHELTRLFWMKKGLRYDYIEDPELTIKIQKAEYLAEQKVRTSEISTEFLKKSEEELAKEFMGYIEKEFPDSRYLTRYIMDVFLEQKGVKLYAVDPTMRLKLEKVQRLVEQKQLQKERELLPELVEECTKWAKGNGFKKMTKTNVGVFLAEKGVSLSTNTRDILYGRVNINLQKER
jgi:hypothetical protein